MSRGFFLLLAKIIQIRVFDRKPITIYLHPTNFQLQHLEYNYIPVNAERESKVRGVVNSFQTTKNQKKETFLCFKSRYLLDVSQRLVTDQKPKKEFRRFILIGFSLIVFWTIQNSLQIFSKSFFPLFVSFVFYF